MLPGEVPFIVYLSFQLVGPVSGSGCGETQGLISHIGLCHLIETGLIVNSKNRIAGGIFPAGLNGFDVEVV